LPGNHSIKQQRLPGGYVQEEYFKRINKVKKDIWQTELFFLFILN
jgi:hypothetical protein